MNNNSEQSKFEESKSPRSSAKIAFLADVDGGRRCQRKQKKSIDQRAPQI